MKKLQLVCVCVCVFIPSTVNGNLGRYHILAIVTSAAMIIGVQVFLLHVDLMCFRYTPRYGIARSCDSFIFKQITSFYIQNMVYLSIFWYCFFFFLYMLSSKFSLIAPDHSPYVGNACRII
jgi:hypothetical protein